MDPSMGSTPSADARARNDVLAGWSCGLLATIPLLPGAVGVATVVAYLVQPTQYLVNHGLEAALTGLAAGGIGWLIMGLFGAWAADPARVSSGMHSELKSRYRLITARLEALDQPANGLDSRSDYKQAVTMRDELAPMFDPTNTRDRLGAQWISGTGYIAAWQRIHRAEEALLGLETLNGVLAAAFYDRGRLRGSKIPARDDLLKQSALAMASLCKGVVPILGGKAIEALDCEDLSRVVLINIRKTINEYRDDLWEALIYLRRRTIQTVLLTGFTGYAAVVLALISDASDQAVIAGAGFYLAGALIGLFHAGYTEQRRRTAVEDYGLSAARLILLPLVAGIAGIIGAAVTAFLAAPPLGLNLLSAPDLAKAFHLGQYPLGLLAAAIFGLTPGLLLQRIGGLGEEVKLDIAKTESSGPEKSETATNDET